jgi:hypothetical protein
MARLRTPPELVSAAINAALTGLGVRAKRRSFGKSHARIIRWERRLAEQGTEHPLTALSAACEVHANHNVGLGVYADTCSYPSAFPILCQR